MVRVIIAGSRSFNDWELLSNSVHDILLNYDTDELEIVSGGCSGADKMGEEYAEEWGIKCTVFQADWDKYGVAAGPIRNNQMGEYASKSNHGMLIAFPLGISKGTKNMIDLAKRYGLEVHVVE